MPWPRMLALCALIAGASCGGRDGDGASPAVAPGPVSIEIGVDARDPGADRHIIRVDGAIARSLQDLHDQVATVIGHKPAESGPHIADVQVDGRVPVAWVILILAFCGLENPVNVEEVDPTSPEWLATRSLPPASESVESSRPPAFRGPTAPFVRLDVAGAVSTTMKLTWDWDRHLDSREWDSHIVRMRSTALGGRRRAVSVDWPRGREILGEIVVDAAGGVGDEHRAVTARIERVLWELKTWSDVAVVDVDLQVPYRAVHEWLVIANRLGFEWTGVMWEGLVVDHVRF